MGAKEAKKITKEWLYKRYHVDGLSTREVAKEAGTAKCTIINYMKKFNVSIREPLRQDLSPIRKCNTCGEGKDLQSAYGSYSSSSGKVWRRICMSCRRAQEATRYKNNPATRDRMKKAARVSRIKNSYGLTLKEVRAMYIRQAGLCAICAKPQAETKINIDHCHSTGRVRGLLCWACNTGLGKFKDNAHFLRNAVNYLKDGE